MEQYRIFMFGEILTIFDKNKCHGGNRTRTLNRVLAILGISKCFSESNTSECTKICDLNGIPTLKTERDLMMKTSEETGVGHSDLVKGIALRLSHSKDFHFERVFEDVKNFFENRNTYIPQSFDHQLMGQLRGYVEADRRFDFVTRVLFLTFFRFTNNFNELRDELLALQFSSKCNKEITEEEEGANEAYLELKKRHAILEQELLQKELETEMQQEVLTDALNEKKQLKLINNRLLLTQHEQKLALKEMEGQVEQYDKLYKEQKTMTGRLSDTIDELKNKIASLSKPSESSSVKMDQMIKQYDQKMAQLISEKEEMNRKYQKIVEQTERQKETLNKIIMDGAIFNEDGEMDEVVFFLSLADGKNKALLEGLDLSHMEPDEVALLEEEATEDYENSLNDQFIEGVDEENLKELESLLNEPRDEAYIISWLSKNAPNHSSDPLFLEIVDRVDTPNECFATFAWMKWFTLYKPNYAELAKEITCRIREEIKKDPYAYLLADRSD